MPFLLRSVKLYRSVREKSRGRWFVKNGTSRGIWTARLIGNLGELLNWKHVQDREGTVS